MQPYKFASVRIGFMGNRNRNSSAGNGIFRVERRRFSVSYQSRNGKTGRHRATLSGLGSWVGPRVASPRCPILRPDLLSVPRSTATVQIPPFRTWLAAGRWPSPVSAFVRPRLPRPDLPACWQGCVGNGDALETGTRWKRGRVGNGDALETRSNPVSVHLLGVTRCQ